MPDPFPQLREKYSSPRIETFQGMELVSLLLCIALHSVEKLDSDAKEGVNDTFE